jgi:hypothetical protein
MNTVMPAMFDFLCRKVLLFLDANKRMIVPVGNKGNG